MPNMLEEGQDILADAMDVPEATPAHYKGQVIKVARIRSMYMPTFGRIA